MSWRKWRSLNVTRVKRIIGAIAGCLHRVAARGDGQHSSAAGDYATVVIECSSSVEHNDVAVEFIQSGNL